MRRASEPCVRQNRVVLAVVATVKLSRRRHSRQPARCPRFSRGRGRPERTRLPGEHGISRQTIAQGRPGVRPHLYAAVQSFCATCAQRTAGAKPAPGLPCALFLGGGDGEKQSSGGICRENAKACLEVENVCEVGFHSRAPDAAQRYFSGALQSRGPCHRERNRAAWVPALRSNARALQRVRDTKVSGDDAPCSVIASLDRRLRADPPRMKMGEYSCLNRPLILALSS